MFTRQAPNFFYIIRWLLTLKRKTYFSEITLCNFYLHPNHLSAYFSIHNLPLRVYFSIHKIRHCFISCILFYTHLCLFHRFVYSSLYISRDVCIVLFTSHTRGLIENRRRALISSRFSRLFVKNTRYRAGTASMLIHPPIDK